MKFYLLLLLYFFIFNNLLFSQNQPKLALLDFSGSPQYHEYIKMFSNKFFSELSNLGKYDIIERKRMNSILREQGFQLTGCTNERCAVKAGNILNAKYVIFGEVSVVPNVISFTVRIVNVETAKIENIKNETCYNCNIEHIMDYSLKNLARKVSNLPPIYPNKPVAYKSNYKRVYNNKKYKRTIGIETDIIPLIINGYNIAMWYGTSVARIKFFVTKFDSPSFYMKDGFKSLGNKFYGVMGDFIISKFLFATGLYYGDYNVGHEEEKEVINYENIIFYMGIGYLNEFYKNFYFRVSLDIHALLIGDESIKFKNGRIFNVSRGVIGASVCFGFHL